MPQTTIATLTGSLRTQSYNTALLRAAAASGQQHGVKFIHLAPPDWPLFNEEREPDAAWLATPVQQLETADAVIIACPEYNAGPSGVLKNALDWLSRGKAPLRGKPVLLVGATPGQSGTLRAQIQARTVLAAMGAVVLPSPDIAVGNAKAKFDDDLRLIDTNTLQYLQSGVQRLIEAVRQRQPV